VLRSSAKTEEKHGNAGEGQEHQAYDKKRMGLKLSAFVALVNGVGERPSQCLDKIAVTDGPVSSEEARTRLFMRDIFEFCHQSTAVA
jgi:hypothetical protein